MAIRKANSFTHRSDGVTEIILERREGDHLVCLIDTTDYDSVKRHRWHAGKSDNTYYVATEIKKPDGGHTTLRLHQLLLSGADEVDHKLGNGLDNRRINLRAATRSQNEVNKSKRTNTSSKFRGVYWYKRTKKFRAHIEIQGKNISLGYFVSEFDAARAYDAAAIKHFGEFARPNFPNTAVGEQAAA